MRIYIYTLYKKLCMANNEKKNVTDYAQNGKKRNRRTMSRINLFDLRWNCWKNLIFLKKTVFKARHV